MQTEYLVFKTYLRYKNTSTQYEFGVPGFCRIMPCLIILSFKYHILNIKKNLILSLFIIKRTDFDLK
ncbi:hypothetical protein DERP_008249 [Dermatophagoides pteronyssinus]|uniref:Uncharacterized protein n=1 Tax=Dermatophagoides pteronyssinus TaxID=6956 RepID=A0ABQ8J605_DERPT|nr:hypothetical protein DERP_008249 [Dermatophagoides pteronyssinus]